MTERSDILSLKEGRNIKLHKIFPQRVFNIPSISCACLLVLALFCVPVNAEDQGESVLSEAMVLVREGYAQEAIEKLEGIVAAPQTQAVVSDRAALILGNLLIKNRRPETALQHLRQATGSQRFAPYARLLIARAAVQGRIPEAYEEATQHALLLHGDTSGTVSLLVQRESSFLLSKLYFLREEWAEAARYGKLSLDQPGFERTRHEARWLTAEGLRKAGQAAEAHHLLSKIWFETPGSPWAIEARRAMERLQSSANIEERTLSATAHYDFVKALRSAGLHDHALQEVKHLFRRHPNHSKADGALFMQTMSQHAKRKNGECVATAERLKKQHPRSPWLPAAGIYAIKCLRRSDNTPEVRRWANWIISNYSGHDKAMEAYYNLGGYLGNVVSKEEGLEVLRRMVDVGGRHEDVRDALWKIAWLERNRGRTNEAIQNLEKLLREHPKTGYRKAALYWQARFLAPTDRVRAISLFQTCVKEFPNHYYGHKALDELTALGIKPQQIGSGKPFPKLDDLSDPLARPRAPREYRMAVELKSIGLYELAAAELEAMPGVEKDLSLQFALAELYSHSGNTWKAAALIKRHFDDWVDSGSRDPSLVPLRFWRVVYPFNYRPEISQALQEAGLRQTGIDPYLTAALIRSESRFFPNAISSVGAVGLMQLMPNLANQVSRQRWNRDVHRSELFDPRTNIRLGTYHLAKLIEGFGGDWAPAICSYNAGVKPVKGWWGRKPANQPLVEFIENIPYLETRLYIKRILADHRNYEWIYGAKRENSAS